MHHKLIPVFSLLIAAIYSPLQLHAAEIKLTSSTQYLWYEDILSQNTEKIAAEYLRFSAANIGKDGNISILGYGRAEKQISSGDDVKGRLYYLYIDYRDAIKNTLDIKLGRQYVYTTAMSDIMNGVTLDFRKVGPVGVRLFGGTTVTFENRTDTTYTGNYMGGATVYYDTIKNTHVELSYGRKFMENDTVREIIGLDIQSTPFKNASVYAKLKHDIITESTAEMLLGLKLMPTDTLTVRAEHYESYPIFDTTSIYSAFSVEQYRENSIKADYSLSNDYRVTIGYARESFDESRSANLYEAGLNAKPIKNLSLTLSYEQRNGYAGQLSGFRANAEYRIAKTTLSAGLDYDDFNRDASRATYAKKIWGGLKHDIGKTINVVVRLEDNINYTFKNSYQGFAALNIAF